MLRGRYSDARSGSSFSWTLLRKSTSYIRRWSTTTTTYRGIVFCTKTGHELRCAWDVCVSTRDTGSINHTSIMYTWRKGLDLHLTQVSCAQVTSGNTSCQECIDIDQTALSAGLKYNIHTFQVHITRIDCELIIPGYLEVAGTQEKLVLRPHGGKEGVSNNFQQSLSTFSRNFQHPLPTSLQQLPTTTSNIRIYTRQLKLFLLYPSTLEYLPLPQNKCLLFQGDTNVVTL